MSRMSRNPRLAAVLLTGAFLLASDSWVQAGDKERQIVGGLLQLLIESQGGGPPPGQRPDQFRPNPAQPNDRSTPELQAAREALDRFATHYDAFSAGLQDDAQRTSDLRPFIAETVQLHAVVESTRRRSHQVYDHRFIMNDAQRLDGEWRVLSHRLRAMRGLGAETRQIIARIDKADADLCVRLQFEPQVDRRELTSAAHTLVVHFRGLCDDIDFEFRGPGLRNSLLLDAGKAQQLVVNFSDRVSRGASYSALVAGYQEFLSVWTPLVRRLCEQNSRFVERSVLRIQETDQEIHDLLWLQRGLDRQVLGQIAQSILRKTDAIYEMVTLNVLITLPAAEELPSHASEFYGVSQHFADCVANSQNDEDLVEAYSYLVPAWVGFSRHFRSCGHTGIHQALRDIENRLSSLREPLRIPGGFRRSEARERVAALAALSEHLEDDLSVWLKGRQEHAAAHARMVQLSRQFRVITQGLHTDVISGAAEPALRAKCSDAYGIWIQIHDEISKCDAPQREHINEVLIEVSRELISVEALFFS